MKEILMGNEAIALGLIHAGVEMISGYPGTPSSEILTSYQKYKAKFNLDVYAQWATNEKVGFEVAHAGAISGKIACATMKQVGLNVASDALMSASYIGNRGAMVVVSADDPGFYSSQTEQDSRSFAKFARVPVFDPSTPQEAYDMAKESVRVSKLFEVPVLLRPVMRVSHARQIVDVDDELSFTPTQSGFTRDIPRWTAVPPTGRFSKGLDQIKRIEDLKEFNLKNYIYPQLENLKGEKFLFITGGTAHGYVSETLRDLSIKADVIKIDMSYPLPTTKLKEVINNYEKVVVFEETYPCIEEQISAPNVYGKLTKHVHEIDEFSNQKTLDALCKLGIAQDSDLYKGKKYQGEIISRPPNLCPGCPHRDMYFAITKVFKKKNAIYPSDIGCYTLGINQGAIDVFLDMGAAVSMASGFAIANPDKTVVATLGDSTFFHSGVTGLINAVYQKHRFILVILDNSIVAMTGRQTTPERSAPEHVDIKKLVEGCGAVCHEYHYVPDLKKSIDFFKNIKKIYEQSDGPVVVVAREFCVLDKQRASEFLPQKFAQVNEEKCIACDICTTAYKCPPMHYNARGKVEIDPFLCIGCSACIDGLCPTDAFEEVVR